MFNIEIAKIVIGIDNRYDEVRKISEDYITDAQANFSVCVTEDEILKEADSFNPDFPKGELESIAIYRKIAERLIDYGAFVFHGAVILFDGKAYLFTAKSGVGKTTHIRLWLSVFKERARILNGDKPVIRVEDGRVFISGTPWRGKEQYGEPGYVPLSGIVFVRRSDENIAYTENPRDAMSRFVTQAHIPKTNAETGIKALRLLDTVINTVPLVTLGCNMDEEAALVAKNAIEVAENKIIQEIDKI